MSKPIRAAEFTAMSKRLPPVLTINLIADGRREHLATYEVSGKREARAIAARHDATPWNF